MNVNRIESNGVDSRPPLMNSYEIQIGSNKIKLVVVVIVNKITNEFNLKSISWEGNY